MLNAPAELLISLSFLVLLAAYVIYLGLRLNSVHRKLDRLLSAFNGLREYLYEIDPQFNDERKSQQDFEYNESIFAGTTDTALQRRKKQQGRRTLNTPFEKPDGQ